MRELTPEEQEAVGQAVNDMHIEGFRITEEKAMALAREALAQNPPPRSVLPFLDIKKIVSGNSHELLLSGRVDAAGARELEKEVATAMRAGAQEICINLSGVRFLHSDGLRVLLQCSRQMKSSRRRLQVTRPSAEVEPVLRAFGFWEKLVERV